MESYINLTDSYLESLELPVIKTNKQIEYINIEVALDVETTSTTIAGEKMAFSYIWQLGIKVDGTVFYGRTWEQLQTTINKLQSYYDLSSDKRMVIYVHNLGYEFQFMRNYFEWEDVFSVQERKPIIALTKQGIEFRDSYILSGYSLDYTAKNLAKHKIDKQVGNLDYSLVRTHETPLTEEELKYCENDVLIVLAYINEQIEQYKDISRVPITNTSRIRKYVKDSCYYDTNNHRKASKGKYIKYSKIMRDLTLDLTSYRQLKRAFMGGFTHSNPLITKSVIPNVDSIDLVSSYPTVMCSEKFPMSKGRSLTIKSIADLKEKMNTYCIVFDIKLTGVKNKIDYESYLSESNCSNVSKPIINNGRIFSADSLTTTITDVDFKIIEQVYEWETIGITNVTGYRKNYLPKSIIESILKLYDDKTTLKGVEGSEVEYLLSKGMLNSVYGMCVTDFVKDNHSYGDKWSIKESIAEEKIEQYNSSKSRFLYYPWGIWITAYARSNLWTAILNVKEDYVYSDTDSIKMVNYDKHKPFIDAYNKFITQKLECMAKYHKLDPVKLSPETINGEKKPLGVWEHEGHYTRFKTLGAKRYIREEDGELYLTVAGLSKRNGIEYLIDLAEGCTEEVFNLFDDNLYIPAESTGKVTHTYIDKERDELITDYLGNTTRVISQSGTHLESCEFTLSMSGQYQRFITLLSKGHVYGGQQNK